MGQGVLTRGRLVVTRLSFQFVPVEFPPLLVGQFSAHGFSTERARLVVQVERLWCTRLRYRTCTTSCSNKRASLRRFAAYRGTSLRSWFQKKCLVPIGIKKKKSENTPNFETLSWIFFRLEFFPHFFPNRGKFILPKLYVCKVSDKSENIFFVEKSACYPSGV